MLAAGHKPKRPCFVILLCCGQRKGDIILRGPPPVGNPREIQRDLATVVFTFLLVLCLLQKCGSVAVAVLGVSFLLVE